MGQDDWNQAAEHDLRCKALPRIHSGSKVIVFEKIMALDLERQVVLYDLLLKLICKGINMLFILEPVVARVKVPGIHKPLFMVLNYGSIVFPSEEFPEELLKLNPVEILDPLWTKVLQPKCIELGVCRDIDVIPSSYPLVHRENTNTNICIADCCTSLLNELNLDYQPMHVKGKLKILDKNHFVTYGLKEILDGVQSDIDALVYIIKEYGKAPLKPLLSIDNEPILFDVVIKPCVLLPVGLRSLDKRLKLILKIILTRSILYISSKYVGFPSP